MATLAIPIYSSYAWEKNIYLTKHLLINFLMTTRSIEDLILITSCLLICYVPVFYFDSLQYRVEHLRQITASIT